MSAPKTFQTVFGEAFNRAIKSAVDWSERARAGRINVNEPYELSYWSTKFGVSPERLKEAVAKVGPMASDLANHLGKSGLVAPSEHEQAMEHEQAERIERQRRLLHYVQVKHTNILRALADR